MLINVIDLEATCWSTRQPPEGERNEIIEIGLCVLDTESLALTRAPRLLIRPQYSRVSAFCTELTGIRPEDVAQAPTFEETFRQLEQSHAVSSRPWISWGYYDRRMLGEATAALGLQMSPQHQNVKVIHGERRGHKPMGLGQACAAENLRFEGRAHRGDDDAYNIARIAARLIREGWVPAS